MMSSVASAGTEIVEAMGYAVDERNKSTVMSAALVPSMFATYSALILNTLPLAAELVTIAVADVPTACTAVLPVIVATFTMFGAAMIYPPNTIAIAMVLPVVARSMNSLKRAAVGRSSNLSFVL
jgi:hypothetical protein